MKVNIGISDKNRQEVANILSGLLADEYILYTKTRNAHWNVEGPDFHDKHKFFESQFELLDEFIDDLAERIRTLGHYVPSTLAAFLELTALSEARREKNDSQGFIKELLEDHETIIIRLRENIKPFAGKYLDLGSSDFITGLMEKHEKMAWFLRSHL